MLPWPFHLRTRLQHPLRSGPRRVLRLWCTVAPITWSREQRIQGDLGACPSTLKCFCLVWHQKGEVNMLGDEDMGDGLMLSEAAKYQC